MNFAEYLMAVPKTLEERRIQTSKQYRREKMREYERKSRTKRKMVQQLLENKTD